MLHQYESYIKEIIKGKRKGFIPFVVRGILKIMSWGFELGVICRNWAFDHGWRKSYSPPTPLVISIGNIVAGGTGKTPLTHFIAQHFISHFSVAILSRGYRSPAEKFSNPIMLSKGAGPIYPANLAGDEPYLLSEKLPQALVFVGKDRKKAALMAEKAGAQVILLDDGMQHRQISRDIDLVVMNAQDLFGKGYFLPRGLLRDSITSLARATLIIINHIESRSHYLSCCQQIVKHTQAPIVGANFVVQHYTDLQGNKVSSPAGKRVGLFCGIGYPEQFKSLIQKQKAFIIDEYFVSDHLCLSQKALIEFAETCAKNGAEWLICTEKDRVKLPYHWEGALPIISVKIELQLTEGQEHWKTLLERAKAKII